MCLFFKIEFDLFEPGLIEINFPLRKSIHLVAGMTSVSGAAQDFDPYPFSTSPTSRFQVRPTPPSRLQESNADSMGYEQAVHDEEDADWWARNQSESQGSKVRPWDGIVLGGGVIGGGYVDRHRN